MVPHVHHVRLGEEDHAVAVGVSAGKVRRFDFFPVEMDRERFVEGNHGPGVGGRGLSVAACGSKFSRQPLADVRVRDDGRLRPEDDIAARVIAVPVRIEDEFQITSTHAFQGCADFLSQRRKLVIDDQNAVFAEGDSDIPARPVQHVDVALDVRGLDFDV